MWERSKSLVHLFLLQISIVAAFLYALVLHMFSYEHLGGLPD
jgi:hypothetical protein